MAEYMWDVRRDDTRALTDREVRQRDHACKAAGGYGYTYVRMPEGVWLGWYSGPNRGYPFDRRLEDRVAAAINAVGV